MSQKVSYKSWFNSYIAKGQLHEAEKLLTQIREEEHDEKWLESLERELFRAYYEIKDWAGAKRIVLVTNDPSSFQGRKDRLESLSKMRFADINTHSQAKDNRGTKLLKKEDLNKVDFKNKVYIVQQKKYFYILTEVTFSKFLFICFTEHDYAMGENDCIFPAMAGYYESAEKAIADVVETFDVYEFTNRQDYILWLLSELRKQLEFYSGDWSE